MQRLTDMMSTQPITPQPKPGEPDKSAPTKQPASPVNPDPKAHPIHPKVPVQPIHEGTDPKTPVTPGEATRGAGPG